MLVFARGSRAASYARATRFPIVVIVTAGRGHSPLKALLVLLVDNFDALLGTVGNDVRRRHLVAARGHLAASLCGAKSDHLVASGVLGADAARLLKHDSEGVAMSTLMWALHTMFR
jgi:hypothetical protein